MKTVILTYTTPGTFYWQYPSHGRVIVELRGPGGNGGKALVDGTVGGGGGGGAYKKRTFDAAHGNTLSPGTIYTIIVSAGGSGFSSTFGPGSLCVALAGANGYLPTGGAGASGSGGVGDSGWSGGNGANGGASYGGGGGGGAGTGSAGGTGSSYNPGKGGGPVGDEGGGGGGGARAGSGARDATPSTAPSGGGGGGIYSGGIQYLWSAGSDGWARITYTEYDTAILENFI